MKKLLAITLSALLLIAVAVAVYFVTRENEKRVQPAPQEPKHAVHVKAKHVPIPVRIAPRVLPGAASASEPIVRVASSAQYVTFSNRAGDWTISRVCQGTDVAGVGYIVRFMRGKRVVSTDLNQGGFAELNSPAHGGMGTFGLELGRGAGERDWQNTQHLSMRRCGIWGVTHSSNAIFGIRNGIGFYKQTLELGTDTDPKLVRIREQYSIWENRVQLSMKVDVCTVAACPSDYFGKEPKIIANVNGQLGERKFSHITTLNSEGQQIIEGECSYTGKNAYKETGHCYNNERRYAILDYSPAPCESANRCLVIEARSAHSSTWENQRGFDRWALVAAKQLKAGESGCVTIDGQAVYSPEQRNARNWEYAVFADASGYSGATFMFKSWDGCKNPLDALSLYRTLTRATYWIVMSFQLRPY